MNLMVCTADIMGYHQLSILGATVEVILTGITMV